MNTKNNTQNAYEQVLWHFSRIFKPNVRIDNIDPNITKCPQCSHVFQSPLELTKHLMPTEPFWQWKKGKSKHDGPMVIYYDFPKPNDGYDIDTNSLEPFPLTELQQDYRYQWLLLDNEAATKLDKLRHNTTAKIKNLDDDGKKTIELRYAELKMQQINNQAWLSNEMKKNWVYPGMSNILFEMPFLDSDFFQMLSYERNKLKQYIHTENQKTYTEMHKAIQISLKEYERILNVKFVRKTLRHRKKSLHDPQMRFFMIHHTNKNAGGFAESPNATYGGDMHFVLYDLSRGNIHRKAFVARHEIGHALGLEHPYCNPTIAKQKTGNAIKKTRYSSNNQHLSSMVGSGGDPHVFKNLGLVDILALAKHYGFSQKYKGKNALYYMESGLKKITTYYYDPKHPSLPPQKHYAGFGFVLHPSGYKTIWAKGGISRTPKTPNNDAATSKTIFHDQPITLRSVGFSSTPHNPYAITSLTPIQELWGGDHNDTLYGNSDGKTILYGGRGKDTLFGSGTVIIDPDSGNDKFHVAGKSHIIFEACDLKDLTITADYLSVPYTIPLEKCRIDGNRLLLPTKSQYIKIHYPAKMGGWFNQSLKIWNIDRKPISIEALGKDNYLLRKNGRTTKTLCNKSFAEQMFEGTEKRLTYRMKNPYKNSVYHPKLMSNNIQANHNDPITSCRDCVIQQP